MRDLLADSRFDIILLRFRSSTTETGRFGPAGEGLESDRLLFGSSDPEPEPENMGVGDWTGLSPEPVEFEVSAGLRGWMAGKSSWQSHGVNPPSKDGNGFPRIESEDGKIGGKVEIMAKLDQSFL